VEEEAREHAADIVATVGMVEALPGAVNVIPGEVTFSIDLRALEDEKRHRAVAAVEERMRSIAHERGLALSTSSSYGESAPPCDPALIQALAEALQRQGHEVFKLPSGAGHDAMAMADLCPIVMLFLRCKGGISHNPAESITPEDAQAAIDVMLDFLVHYRPSVAARGAA
jgi:allantoate deiminase